MTPEEKTIRSGRMHYCPVCGHTITQRLIGEVMDELGIRERTIGTAPVGCAVLLYDYFNCDIIECPHGRIPAVATGIKRMRPDNIVFGYGGDGDLLSIGLAETIHCANRGENITMIFINNAVYGMTGGQMAPTTLIGQKTITTPEGRMSTETGAPLRICEMFTTLARPVFIERVAVHDAPHMQRAKQAIHKAFQNQIDRKGFSFVEVLSMCPTHWKMGGKEACQFVGNEMASYFPIKKFRDVDG
ncbi:MAG: thiamine pyrophosphate-dependent enzyme [Candidatus Omnitrophota bacterium]